MINVHTRLNVFFLLSFKNLFLFHRLLFNSLKCFILSVIMWDVKHDTHCVCYLFFEYQTDCMYTLDYVMFQTVKLLILSLSCPLECTCYINCWKNICLKTSKGKIQKKKCWKSRNRSNVLVFHIIIAPLIECNKRL